MAEASGKKRSKIMSKSLYHGSTFVQTPISHIMFGCRNSIRIDYVSVDVDVDVAVAVAVGRSREWGRAGTRGTGCDRRGVTGHE